MELLQLKYFCHAAETQNFSRTARTFLVPHSNISQCIKKLETELGNPLFDRSGNRVVLNSRGQAFYREIRSALDTIENATAAARGGAGPTTLRVGIRLGIRVVMTVIAEFQYSHPEVDVISKRFTPGSDPGEFDLIIADGSFSAPGFASTKLFTDNLCLVAAKGILPEDPFNAEYLCRQSFITIRTGSSMYTDLHRVCESFGVTPRISLQCEESFYVLQHVEAGFGLAVVPYHTALRHGGDRVDIQPIDSFTRTNCLYHSKKFQSPQLLDEFEKLLRKEFAHVHSL